MRVAIQGIAGSFHDIAARHAYGPDIDLVPCDTFGQLAERVRKREADRGVMAIENSLVGTILPNYGLITAAQLRVHGEVALALAQQLVGLPGATLEELVEVRSHPMALSQCEDFLARYPQWRRVEASDTAGSARDIAALGDLRCAAIAPRAAALAWGLVVLAPNIQSHRDNVTRFWCLAPEDGGASMQTAGSAWATSAPFGLGPNNTPPSPELLPSSSPEPSPSPQPWRTSLYFTLRDQPGALHAALGVFAAAQWSLSKIQSVPIAGALGQYRFFVDLKGPPPGPAVWQTLGRHATEVQLLGCYPVVFASEMSDRSGPLA